MDIDTADPEVPLIDVRDMIVVHTALLRELRLAPSAVERTRAGVRRQARVVDRHINLLCSLLHHHHQGEDTLLWPLLQGRLPANASPFLDGAEAEHAAIEAALRSVDATRQRWVEGLDADSRRSLVRALGELYELAAEHLETEERTLLPLAAAHLTDDEWGAIGEAGAAAVSKRDLPLVFGMFAYEGDPEVLAQMLQSAPMLPRLLVPRLAPRVYARHAAKVHGTPRP